MEIWDLYDKDRKPLFRTQRRDLEMNAGEYHTVVEVWTVNSDHQILVTLRDSAKVLYPGKWENTGGSALSGENSRQAAVRELREETGIVAGQEELTFLGDVRGVMAFHDIYVLRRNVPLRQLTLQPGETVDAQWITLAQLDAMIEDRTLAESVGQCLNHVREPFLRFLFS